MACLESYLHEYLRRRMYDPANCYNGNLTLDLGTVLCMQKPPLNEHKLTLGAYLRVRKLVYAYKLTLKVKDFQLQQNLS